MNPEIRFPGGVGDEPAISSWMTVEFGIAAGLMMQWNPG
jgi:hypothetical protein